MTKKTKAVAKTKQQTERQIMDALGLQAVPVPCDAHQRYQGMQKPRKTSKNPEGCPECWAFYNAKLLVNESLPELYVRRHGQPRKFTEAGEIATAGMDYFKWCHENEQIPTKTGLAVFMGVCTDTVRKYRVGDYDAKGDKPTHSAVVKRIDDVIIAGIEQVVLKSRGNTTGPIAWLNNNAGWSQNVRQQVEMGVTVKLTDYSKGIPWTKKPDTIESTATDVPAPDADR